MANSWFRLYSEFADDPKVQIMSEAMQRRLAMLFCWRCKCDGDVTFRETEMAFHWRISIEEMQATKVLFVQQGFIDERWNLLHWSKRQFLSDSSTDRTRRYRERARTSRERHGNVTEHDVTVSVTAPDTDTDTDTDTESTTTTTLPLSQPTPKKRRNRKAIVSEYSAEAREVVNSLLDVWPAKQPDGKNPIRIDVADLADRIDGLLHQPGVTPAILIESAKLYLQESKYKRKAPQYFFGAGNGDGAHWLSYARLYHHEKTITENQDADLFSAREC